MLRNMYCMSVLACEYGQRPRYREECSDLESKLRMVPILIARLSV